MECIGYQALLLLANKDTEDAKFLVPGRRQRLVVRAGICMAMNDLAGAAYMYRDSVATIADATWDQTAVKGTRSWNNLLGL